MARKQVLVQLDDDVVEQLDRISSERGVSRSDLLRTRVLAVIAAEDGAVADRQLVAGYTAIPPDPDLLLAAARLAADTAPPW